MIALDPVLCTYIKLGIVVFKERHPRLARSGACVKVESRGNTPNSLDFIDQFGITEGTIIIARTDNFATGSAVIFFTTN